MKVRIFNRKNFPITLAVDPDPMNHVVIPPNNPTPIVADLTAVQVEQVKLSGLKVETA